MTSADSRYSHSSPLYSASTWTASQRFNDNVLLQFGDGDDSTLKYDGTNLLINPKAVGSGHLKVDGDAFVTQNQKIGISEGSNYLRWDGSANFDVNAHGDDFHINIDANSNGEGENFKIFKNGVDGAGTLIFAIDSDGDINLQGGREITTSSSDLTLNPAGSIILGTNGTDDNLKALLAATLQFTRVSSNLGAQAVQLFSSASGTQDANARFQIRSDGYMAWGAGGGTAVDTALTRSAAGTLQFQQATTLSTSGSDLTLAPAGNVIINPGGTGGTLSFNDTSTDHYFFKIGGAFTSGGSSTITSGITYDAVLTTHSADDVSAAHMHMGADLGANIILAGDCAVVATMYLTEPNINITSGDVTTAAATLYINNAPTEQAGGNNYALFVDAGTSRFDGPILFSAANGLFTSAVTGITTNSADLILEAVDNMGFMIGSDGGAHIFDWSTGDNFGGSPTQVMTLTAASVLNFPAATTISTGASNLTLNPAGDLLISAVTTWLADADYTATADEVSIFRHNIGTNNTVLGIAQETAVATETDETKFSHKMQVRINGATYFLMLTQT